MGLAYLFPGQGSQAVGMGKDLFARFPELIGQVNGVLGYSVDELCLRDPHKQLRQTQFTQPALYVVGALGYLARQEDGTERPDYLAGHSLGEYVALFAAGCFDFETGLALVNARARVMSEMSEGSMVAITQLEAPVIESLLQESSADGIDIANYNTPTQTVLSGDRQQLLNLSELVSKNGGRLHPLNVSGAFHSRYMRGPQQQFEQFAQTVTFRAPQIPVVANLSAVPYPNHNDEIRRLLTDQIASPVRWGDSIEYLRRSGVDRFIELGSGKVLTRLNEQILARPARPDSGAPPRHSSRLASPSKKNPTTILLCPDLQTESSQAAEKRYHQDSTFRKTFDQCEDIVQSLYGESIKNILSNGSGHTHASSPVLHVHLLHFASRISDLSVIRTEEIEVCSYIGWGLGEYVALCGAKAITLSDAFEIVGKQAQYLEEHTQASGMLAIYANVNLFHGFNKLFSGARLAGIAATDQFVIAGADDRLFEIAQALEEKNIYSGRLPVNRASCSDFVEPVRDHVNQIGEGLNVQKPIVPVYSCALGKSMDTIEPQYLWHVCRSRYHVPKTIALAREAFPEAAISRITQLDPIVEESEGPSPFRH